MNKKYVMKKKSFFDLSVEQVSEKFFYEVFAQWPNFTSAILWPERFDILATASIALLIRVVIQYFNFNFYIPKLPIIIHYSFIIMLGHSIIIIKYYN
jgi:hypothetical protein